MYPIKVSENGRYFTDREGNPIFWLGTTQWELFRGYTLAQARTILESCKARGFAFAQVMLLGVGDGALPNAATSKPWIGDDPLAPNEAYFRNVDAVVRLAGENDVVIVLTLFHQRYRRFITVENARAWAKWVAQRYRDAPHLIWTANPEANQEDALILRELAAGLREGDGGAHLISFMPDPAPFSSSFLHEEPWLDFNAIQTWRWVQLIVPMVTSDYNREPVKPVLMGEGAYENGSEYGFAVTPLWVRRQAYYSYLAGAHHAYGHNDSWRMLPTWEEALDAPGAVQLGILKRIFLERAEWWHLVPDQSLFASGGNVSGEIANLAARHRDGRWAIIYLGDAASFTIRMDKFAHLGYIEAFWIDPRTGEATAIGRLATAGVRAFTTPETWEDALLILEAPAD